LIPIDLLLFQLFDTATDHETANHLAAERFL